MPQQKKILEGLPKVSHSSDAHYKVQSSAYDRLQDNGPLTDRKIAKYKKMGYFSNGFSDPRLQIKEEAERQRNGPRRRTLKQLLDEYQ